MGMTDNDTPLGDIAPAILDHLSEAVLEIGPLLDQVFHHLDGSSVDFDVWVEDNLPLQPRTAARIRAMWFTHEHRNGEDPPEAWKALWSLE